MAEFIDDVMILEFWIDVRAFMNKMIETIARAADFF